MNFIFVSDIPKLIWGGCSMVVENASCKLFVLEDINVIKSVPRGVWGAELTQQNLKDIISLVEKFNGKPWAFLGIMIDMAPVIDPEASRIFSTFHEEFEKLNCKAIAFVVGGRVVLKAQTQRHHDTSGVKKMAINHFNDEPSAIKWLKGFNIDQ